MMGCLRSRAVGRGAGASSEGGIANERKADLGGLSNNFGGGVGAAGTVPPAVGRGARRSSANTGDCDTGCVGGVRVCHSAAGCRKKIG